MLDIKQFNEKIRESYSASENSYSKFLTQYFPMWEIFDREIVGENVLFYKDNQKVFSLRIDRDTKKFVHIDFYSTQAKKPHKRVLLSNECVTFIRYYEFNTWERNYDVILGKNFIPRYTKEYFENGNRWIDWYYQAGKVFYDENKFMTFISQSILTNIEAL